MPQQPDMEFENGSTLTFVSQEEADSVFQDDFVKPELPSVGALQQLIDADYGRQLYPWTSDNIWQQSALLRELERAGAIERVTLETPAELVTRALRGDQITVPEREARDLQTHLRDHPEPLLRFCPNRRVLERRDGGSTLAAYAAFPIREFSFPVQVYNPRRLGVLTDVPPDGGGA